MRAACCAFLMLCSGGAAAQSGAQSDGGWWAQKRADGGVEAGAQTAPASSADASPPAPAPMDSAAPATLASVPLSAAVFDCVEVARFEVNQGLISSKQEARAAMIPAEKLADIQRSVAGNIPEKIPGMRAALEGGGADCPDPQRTISLTGHIIDFKKGNQALRYFVGFGAGAQKFSVTARAVRKSDGALLAEGDVTDRKVGGWVGGNDDKGLDDFGEKVAMFLKRSLPSSR